MHKKYLIILLLFIIPASVVPLIHITVSCPISDDAEYYLSYCGNPQYGDYEHAAFYYHMEPGIAEHLKKAKVLFLGNSKVQITFSSSAVGELLRSYGVPYYLLGFNGESYEFPMKLIEKYNIHPKVMIISADGFLNPGITEEARAVMNDSKERVKAYLKIASQYFRQEIICSLGTAKMTSLWCKGNGGILRSRVTGEWKMFVSKQKIAFTPEEGEIDGSVDLMAANMQKIIQTSGIDPSCVILTVVPAPNSTPANARQIAKKLDLAFILPKIDKMAIMDCCHLDLESSDRWTKALMKQAAPIIKRCTK